MKTRTITLLLITALMLSSCAVPVKSTSPNSSTIPCPTALLEEKGKIVKGASLGKVGYHCEVPPDLKDKNDIFLDQWSSAGNNYSEQRVDKLLGEDTYTLISVYFYGPHSLGAETLSFMCLQAFSTVDAHEKNLIKIGEELYNFNDLDSYLVFKADDICVYDVYQLIGGDNLKNQIIKQVDIHNGLVKQCVLATAEDREKFGITMTDKDYVTYDDYDYLYDIAEYYTTHTGEIIVKK